MLNFIMYFLRISQKKIKCSFMNLNYVKTKFEISTFKKSTSKTKYLIGKFTFKRFWK